MHGAPMSIRILAAVLIVGFGTLLLIGSIVFRNLFSKNPGLKLFYTDEQIEMLRATPTKKRYSSIAAMAVLIILMGASVIWEQVTPVFFIWFGLLFLIAAARTIRRWAS